MSIPSDIPKHARSRLLALAVFLAANLAVGYRVYSSQEDHDSQGEALKRLRIMMQVMHLIERSYVDAEKAVPENLLDDAIRGMVGHLDPYSSYLDTSQYKSLMEDTEGQFGGIGIMVGMREGLLTIITPMEDTPGQRAGLLAGDQIVKIEGESTRELGMSEAVGHLKGEPGAAVTLTIRRPDTGEEFDVTIVRELIEVPSVKNAQVLQGDVIYLRITQFSDPTAEDLEKSLDQLLNGDREIAGVIVDLRNNPGGLLQSAVDVCALFLPRDSLVVYTEGRQPSQRRDYTTDRRPIVPKSMPVAILVNGGSASAAEIVSGCLQDWNRALLVGEKTFGKGSVQNVIRLSEEAALRLTTAKYYTPSKRVIHENGIEPDITVELSREQMRLLVEERRELASQGSTEIPMDPQLVRAVETLRSYRVYENARAPRLKPPAATEDPIEVE